jgi:hypothetical protein
LKYIRIKPENIDGDSVIKTAILLLTQEKVIPPRERLNGIKSVVETAPDAPVEEPNE